MNVAIWVLQVLLALAFLAAGLTKLTQPRQKLAATHRRRGELPMIGVNAVLLVLAVVVAWARFGPYSL
jgi:uncharacterized membrane protein YphA (DoxX/SURF4 family)